MSSTLDAARALIAEGDRLLGRAAEHGRTSRPGGSATNLDLAEQYYAQAAHAYLAGAAEYQRVGMTSGQTAAVGEDEHGPARLSGRLRIEADAALRDAQHRVAGHSRNTTLDRARVFAEGLRERLAHAAPMLFDGNDKAAGRTPETGWGRAV